MSDLSYYRDEIIRAALHSIDRGTTIPAAISAAVDSALEFALINKLNESEDIPLREVLSEEALREATFMVATRRQPTPPPLPAGKNKESEWWKLNR